MGHIEGFDGLEEGGVKQFIERFTAVWKTGRTRARGSAEDRYGLTIGLQNRRAAFEPQVTTREGTKTLYIWNLLTEDIQKIKKEAVEIGLEPYECPYYWPTTPAVFPGEFPAESLPLTRKEAEKEKKKEE